LPKGISIAFTKHLRTKYDSFDFDDECLRSLAELVRVERQLVYADIIETPFDPSEIYNAIQSGGRNRPPGRDGLGIEFYKANWEILPDDLYIILNHMFFGDAITSQQIHGTLFCLPKPHRMLTPSDYRPITLLNTDYKIVARILALDFKNALDRISHNYIFTILNSYSLSASFINRLKTLYDDAASSVQINGHTHGPIPIR